MNSKKCQTQNKYYIVSSSRLSWLVAHSRIFKLFMKGKFYAYVLWPLAKWVQNWIVDQSIARDFTVFGVYLFGFGLRFCPYRSWNLANVPPKSVVPTRFDNIWMGSSPITGLTLASKTKMWLSAHRAEQWCSLGWRLQRLAPLTSLAAVGRRRLRGAKTRLLEPAPRAAVVGWRGGCFDGPQRALKRGARYDQATASRARRCHRRTSLAQCAAAVLWGSARERQI